MVSPSFRPLVLALLTLPLACSSASGGAGASEAGEGGSRDATAPVDAHHDATRPVDARHDAISLDAGADAYVDAYLRAADGPIPGPDGTVFALAPWNTAAGIAVNGFAANDAGHTDCRTEICRHNENTDMIRWQGAIYLVHRTAMSQVLGPNSSILIYKSVDDGVSFRQLARILAPETPLDADDFATMGRDLRDPAFFIVTAPDGSETLSLKAITRLPTDPGEVQTRDSNVDSISVGTSSSDGVHWSPLTRLAPTMWSFWRVKKIGAFYYSAAYHDGDSSVSLFISPDGINWEQGAVVYGDSAATPLETELVEMPNGNMLALVRTDGDDASLFGNNGMQTTQICWASPPFATFDCSNTLLGDRLDGPVAFFWSARLFVVARREVDTNGVRDRMRTALFELTPGNGGTWDDTGPLTLKDWGDLPSAGDTSYAGVAFVGDASARVSWYSGDVAADLDWLLSLVGPTNIWLGTFDFSVVN
jgi:hypothetical protein